MKSENLLRGGSPERFGYSWAKFHSILPVHEEQFSRWTVSLERSFWADATVLDVGCGMGRNTYWAVKSGAKKVVAIDVDDQSLASARINLEKCPQVEIKKISAYEIPEMDYFDIVFSIGVIHHLASPELALQAMVRAAKPGGRVLVWVYGLENNEWVVHFFDPLRKLLFSRLPLSVVYHLSLYPTLLLWLYIRIFPVKIEYLQLIRKFSFEHLRAIVFDQMLPRIANYWPKNKVISLLTEAGLKDVNIAQVNEISWSACGVKNN